MRVNRSPDADSCFEADISTSASLYLLDRTGLNLWSFLPPNLRSGRGCALSPLFVSWNRLLGERASAFLRKETQQLWIRWWRKAAWQAWLSSTGRWPRISCLIPKVMRCCRTRLKPRGNGNSKSSATWRHYRSRYETSLTSSLGKGTWVEETKLLSVPAAAAGTRTNVRILGNKP